MIPQRATPDTGNIEVSADSDDRARLTERTESMLGARFTAGPMHHVPPIARGLMTDGRFQQIRPGRTPLVRAMVVATVALGAAPAPASAVPGVQRVSSPFVSNNSASPKTAVAYCPVNQRVIGGGGVVSQADDHDPPPVLTGLRPVRLHGAVTTDAYVVTAAEVPTPRQTVKWSLRAHAMCADPLAGRHIISHRTSLSPLPKQATAAVCPNGERVIGTGGRISAPAGEAALDGRVVLQAARPSGSGDIARVQAHANGYPGTWSVTAYAICAPPPAGYQVLFAESLSWQSEPDKTAGILPGDACPLGTLLHSSGAAISSIAPGSVSLLSIFPSTEGRRTVARAVENTPTPLNWDFIVATRICAS
jgi:hypothetical protein